MRTLVFSLGRITLLWALLCSPILAQRGGRGGEDGGRGGFGGRGGAPGADFGGRGGTPGGGFGGRGGTPGGGFGGRGGTPGGGFGGRGGFDPSAMISRFDTNGNGQIDPSENTGIAGMMLSRMAQRDPSIDLSKPIPISKLTSSMSSMRGNSGGPPGGSSPESNEPELLVPDFSLGEEPMVPEAFGAINSSLFSVKVEERDVKEAEERMRRYDRNKDGKLSAEELRSGRWSDDPMQYDRNKDGFLTATELASRYANRRIADEERRASFSGRGGSPWSRGGDSGNSPWSRGGGSDGWSKSDDDKNKKVDRFGDAKSYRMADAESSGSSELPAALARMDKNGDGQVRMNEFSQKWNEKTLATFLKFDLNNDGVIVAQESNAALESGVRLDDDIFSSSSSSYSSKSRSEDKGDSRSSREPETPRTRKPSSVEKSNPAAPEYVEWAKKAIKRYDKDGNGELTKSEWEKMIIKPTGADANGDGVISVEEYAQFRAAKKK